MRAPDGGVLPDRSTFGEFVLTGRRATGGMGTVYLARHRGDTRPVALKVLRAEFSGDADFRDRFVQEARRAAQLIHPNIVRVRSHGRWGQYLWMAMDYIAGPDAAEVVRAGNAALTPEHAVAIITEIAEALDYAHSRRLVHGDVKPENILLVPGWEHSPSPLALLTDFGTARTFDDEGRLPSSGQVLATVAYASPEQLRGKSLDGRADQYSLGATLYELLTRSVPFPLATQDEIIAAHLDGPPPAASAISPGLGPAIDAVIATAMAKAPQDRFSSCREFAAAARAALAASDSAPAAAPLASTAPTGADSLPRLVSLRHSGPEGAARELGPVVVAELDPALAARIASSVVASRFLTLPPFLGPDGLLGTDGRASVGPAEISGELVEIAVECAGETRVVAFRPGLDNLPAGLADLGAAIETAGTWRPIGDFAGSVGDISAGTPSARQVRPTSRRAWPAAAAALLVLALAAGGFMAQRALGAAEQTWASVAGGSPATAALAAAFPEIVPPTPSGRGPEGARCQSTTSPNGGIAQISCSTDESVIYSLVQFSSPADATRYAETGGVPGRRWSAVTASPGSAGLVYPSPPVIADGWAFSTFDSPTMASLVVLAQWPGHTGDALLAGWWSRAGFAG